MAAEVGRVGDARDNNVGESDGILWRVPLRAGFRNAVVLRAIKGLLKSSGHGSIKGFLQMIALSIPVILLFASLLL